MDRCRLEWDAFRRVAGLLWLAAALGCQGQSEREVVVYTAHDREFSEPLFEQFTQQTGIVVRAKYDTEASKSVGLTNLILNEQARPRCDLFWNNEILNTMRLARADALAEYKSPVGGEYPAEYRSAEHVWYGFAARARVLLVNTQRLGAAPRPTSVQDLLDPQYGGQVGIAKPLFGTTATHAACLFSAWGPERTTDFFRQLKSQVEVFPGNRQVAQAVGQGQILFGLTDTDDAVLEIESGRPVEIVYPDQGDEQPGTLFIPNSLALIRQGPHPELAQQLLDFLLSPVVEARLAEGRSAQIPLHPEVHVPLRVATPLTVRPMKVDFAAAAALWQQSAQTLRDLGY